MHINTATLLQQNRGLLIEFVAVLLFMVLWNLIEAITLLYVAHNPVDGHPYSETVLSAFGTVAILVPLILLLPGVPLFLRVNQKEKPITTGNGTWDEPYTNEVPTNRDVLDAMAVDPNYGHGHFLS